MSIFWYCSCVWIIISCRFILDNHGWWSLMSWDEAQATWVLSSMWTRRPRKMPLLASEHRWNNGNVHRERERERDKRWQEMTRDDKRWQEMTRDDKRWQEKNNIKKDEAMEKCYDLPMELGVCPCLSHFWTLGPYSTRIVIRDGALSWVFGELPSGR